MNWKGNNVGYNALHQWIRKNKFKHKKRYYKNKKWKNITSFRKS